MRKFTLILASLFLSLSAVKAENVVVTDWNNLSNDKVYFLESARCFLLYSSNVSTQIASSNGTSVGSVEKNVQDLNQQFKIEKDGESYYLYSVGAGKYVTSNGSFSDTKSDALTFENVGGDYMWKLCIGGNGMNSQDAGQMNAGITVNGWTTTDAGNCYKITEIDVTLPAVVEMSVINSEYNAAKAVAQNVLNINLASEEQIAAVNAALANAETAYNALEITDEAITLEAATAFRELIAAINTAAEAARVFLTDIEDLNNTTVFAISTYDRGSWVSNGSAITSTQKASVAVDVTSAAQQFAFIESESGNIYLYSVADAKFVSASGNYTTLTEMPAQAATLLTSESNDYMWVVALVSGEDYKHLGISNGYNPALISFYNGLGDAGNQARLEKVGTLSEEALNAALAKIAIFETPKIQDDVVFNWTTSTAWTNVEVNNFTSTVMNDNVLGTVDFIEGEIAIEGARTANVTFQYTGGACALNVLGVEVIDANDNIVAADYHAGKTGSSNTDNIYTVNVVEVGTYKVRCYATFDDDNRAGATNGTITIAFEEAQVETFSHTVSFVAEYATLHLGYKVAIPEGVEAYVVSEANEGWATLSPVTGVIPAATSVILKNVGEETSYEFNYTEETAATVATNLLNGSIADRYVVADAYVLANGESGVGLYKAAKNQDGNVSFKNNANKAYLVVPAANEASYSFRFEGTTGVENVVVENGAEAIFDLTGRKVETINAAGIYVVNGKKVLVK